MATRALSQEEQVSMLAAFNSTRDRLLFLTGIYTGFRIHELLALRVGNVWRDNEPAREITVARQHLKSGASAFAQRVKSRTVPMHPVLQATVQSYINLTYPTGFRQRTNAFSHLENEITDRSRPCRPFG